MSVLCDDYGRIRRHRLEHTEKWTEKIMIFSDCSEYEMENKLNQMLKDQSKMIVDSIEVTFNKNDHGVVSVYAVVRVRVLS